MDLIEFPKVPRKVIEFPKQYRTEAPGPLTVREQITDLMWMVDALAQEMTAMNHNLIKLVQTLKEKA